MGISKREGISTTSSTTRLSSVVEDEEEVLVDLDDAGMGVLLLIDDIGCRKAMPSALIDLSNREW